MISETFSDLLRDPAHWEFELLVGFVEMIIFDVLIFGVLWKHIRHHLDRDNRESLPAQNICETENTRALRSLFGVTLPLGAVGFKIYGGDPPVDTNLGFGEGFCPFCQNPLVANDANYEHCEVCGATRVHDEWIEADKTTEVKA